MYVNLIVFVSSYACDSLFLYMRAHTYNAFIYLYYNINIIKSKFYFFIFFIFLKKFFSFFYFFLFYYKYLKYFFSSYARAYIHSQNVQKIFEATISLTHAYETCAFSQKIIFEAKKSSLLRA